MLAQTTRGQLGAPSFRVLCERGKPSHVARTLLSARSHSRRCRRERPRSCSPYHCHPGKAESCARAGLPTKDLRISGLPRMLRRNLVQSKPGTARLLVLEPALSDPKGAEQLPFLIVIPNGFSREEFAADDLAGTKVPQVRTPLLGANLGDTLRANRSQLPRHRRLKESVHVLS